ncbi:hypothetical protein REH65_11725 [Saccharopolyspora sp. ID03-671]|uniref:hypothetical protein n=1 Tax=Saccharopolyspora sp. ID03-671 TaxID=3073066 RepID=UPI003250B79F
MAGAPRTPYLWTAQELESGWKGIEAMRIRATLAAVTLAGAAVLGMAGSAAAQDDDDPVCDFAEPGTPLYIACEDGDD